MDETTSPPTDTASVTIISVDAPAPPTFETCMAAVSANATCGIDALGALSGPLQHSCPELAVILRSSAVRTSFDIYKRQDVEAVRQQASLMQEATWANICLMAAGVTSGLVLAVTAQPSAPEYAAIVGNVTLGLGNPHAGPWCRWHLLWLPRTRPGADRPLAGSPRRSRDRAPRRVYHHRRQRPQRRVLQLPCTASHSSYATC